MQPTELGVRFTPELSRVISMKFTEQMTRRYGLDEDQSRKIQEVMSRQFMGFVRENARPGRDFIEKMMAMMIEHDGNLPKEQGIEFARLMNPLFPALKEFVSESSGEIGKLMTTKQRLKYMGDIAGASVAITLFESRMKRWEEGKVSDGANPFRGNGRVSSDGPDSRPADPNESKAHRRARTNAEPRVERDMNIDRGWEEYVNQAIAYYGFDDAQTESARAILKDCRDRLATRKTPALQAAMTTNRIARQLTWRTSSLYSQGPWMFRLQTEYDRLRKPLLDLEREFKRRIEALPNAKQRAKAEQAVREALEARGMDRPPV